MLERSQYKRRTEVTSLRFEFSNFTVLVEVLVLFVHYVTTLESLTRQTHRPHIPHNPSFGERVLSVKEVPFYCHHPRKKGDNIIIYTPNLKCVLLFCVDIVTMFLVLVLKRKSVFLRLLEKSEYPVRVWGHGSGCTPHSQRTQTVSFTGVYL